jgi:prephenate dehydrogenase
LERQPLSAGAAATAKADFALRHLRRFALGTPYTAIVSAVTTLRRTGQLCGAALIVDQTGVGRAVVDVLRQAAGGVVPVTITGGHSITVAEDGSFHVPKKELVSGLQVVLQSQRLQIASGLTEASALVHELQQFQVRITASAHETFGVWRAGQHDDLVLERFRF